MVWRGWKQLNEPRRWKGVVFKWSYKIPYGPLVNNMIIVSGVTARLSVESHENPSSVHGVVKDYSTELERYFFF